MKIFRSNTAIETPYSIDVKGLTRRFGEFTAVDHISFSVKKGEIFGFLGANGAGKTTAIRMLCGLLQPTEGSALIAGYDLKTQSKFIKRNIGYMSQRFSLYDDLSVFENMQLFGTIYGIPRKELKERIYSSLRMLDLEDKAKTLVYGTVGLLFYPARVEAEVGVCYGHAASSADRLLGRADQRCRSNRAARVLESDLRGCFTGRNDLCDYTLHG